MQARAFKEKHPYADDCFNAQVGLAEIIELQKSFDNLPVVLSASHKVRLQIKNLTLQLQTLDSVSLCRAALQLQNYGNAERSSNTSSGIRLNCLEKEQAFFRKWIFACKFGRDLESITEEYQLSIEVREIILWFLVRWQNADSIEAYYLQKFQIDFLISLGYPLAPLS
jgi:hypothetical protein